MDKLPKIGQSISGWTRVGILRVDVKQGCESPWGYGLSYWRYDHFYAVCYPIFINWIVWIFREIYLRIRETPRGIESVSYNKGYEDGLKMRERITKEDG